MENVYVTREPSCYGVRLGRECAIRACVINTPTLRREFDALYDPDAKTDISDIWAEYVKEFATRKGLEIVSEKPIMMIDGNRYDVDIEYKIVW